MRLDALHQPTGDCRAEQQLERPAGQLRGHSGLRMQRDGYLLLRRPLKDHPPGPVHVGWKLQPDWGPAMRHKYVVKADFKSYVYLLRTKGEWQGVL